MRLITTGILAFTCTASAQISYSDADRRISTFLQVGASTPDQEITSDLTGLFDEGLSDFLYDGGESASASVRQHSRLNPDRLTYEGEVDAFGSTDSFSQARTQITTTFSIASAVDYFFAASFTGMSVGKSGSFHITMRLDGPGAESVFAIATSDIDIFTGGDIDLPSIAGTLNPGDYTFEMDIRAGGLKGTSNITGYRGALIVPTPATAVFFLTIAATAHRTRRRVAS